MAFNPVAVGDQITAAQWNLLTTFDPDAWTAYTPTLTATTTNPTLGTGSSTLGRYCTDGKLVSAYVRILFGTSGTAAGSGQYIVSLPLAPQLGGSLGNHLIGQGQIRCAGVFTLVQINSDGKMRYITAAVGGSQTIVTQAAPGAWGTSGDLIELMLDYEAA